MVAPVPMMDEAEFRALYRSTLDDLWRFVRRRCATDETADDVTAETYLTAWRRRDAMPRDSDARLWLFGAARKVLANHQRGERRWLQLQKRIQMTWIQPRSVDPAELMGINPKLARAFARLKPAEREVLVMQAWDGLTVGEMAAVLGVTDNAVSVRLYKARHKLEQELRTDAGTTRTRTGRSLATTTQDR